GLNRAVVHRIFAEGLFFVRLWLFENVRESLIVVAHEVRWRSFAAQVAIDALRIDVVAAWYLSGYLVVWICHFENGFSPKGTQRRRARAIARAGILTGGSMKRILATPAIFPAVFEVHWMRAPSLQPSIWGVARSRGLVHS